MKSKILNRTRNIIGYIFIITAGFSIGIGTKYGFDLYNQQPNVIQTNTSNHYQDIDSKVIIYTTQWCPFCKKAKQYLTKHNIDYIERDIESGNKETIELYESIGYPGVPKIVVGSKIINGFNESLLSKELKSQNLL
ncbi:glutaredoxin family protein [Shewanella sp. KX20019]|uniref:glutaredoxin family protein n=1 Tax=Shewanella sp. KX20019 TaxID=2803864 RepID=UPI001925C219|nr:glutaredoxin family protein [Shewanella sp. KX20019]QQX80042.1 glutaredoxin family protein [Shewanella sp. KX20019]